MQLRLTSAAHARMLAHGRRSFPNECCGILLGGDGLVHEARPAGNVAADPRRHFEIDPRALIDAHRSARVGGAKVIGYYHSHPQGSARPSATDQAMAAGDNSVWAIIGEDGLTFWRDTEAGFEPLSYAVEER